MKLTAMLFRPLPVMSAFALASLILLIWLGNWQYGKFRQKTALQASPPEFSQLDGTVAPGGEVLLYAYADGEAGWQRLVAVDRGDALVWTAIELSEGVEPPAVKGATDALTGLRFSARGLYVTRHGRNALSNADAPAARRYHTFDATALAVHLPAGAAVAPELFQPETIRFVRDGRAFDGPNPFARRMGDEKMPPQRHFGYALTWWGLAASLIGVYLAFHARAGRLRFGADHRGRP